MAKVVIDLSQKRNDGNPITYQASTSTGTGKQITVKKTSEPPGSNFYKYTHRDSTGEPFTLLEVKDDSSAKIPVIGRIERVTSVSAHYWASDTSKSLIVGVTTKGGTTYYSKDNNSSTGWIGQHQLSGEALETKLDNLNCLFNRAVAINLTENAHGTGNKYCCTYHSTSTGKISVTSGKVSCEIHKSTSSVPYFKHDVDQGILVAGIYYRDRSNKKRINIPNLENSGNSSLTVYAFYCNGKNPLLIYVEGGDKVKGWYQNGNGDEEWKNVSGKLQGITPINFGSLKCNQWNELVTVLKSTGGCSSYKPCPEPPKAASQKNPDPPEPASPQASAEESTPTAQTASQTTGETAKVTGAEPFAFATLGYALSGSLAGAGATFFGGWKLYNRYKGDHWVRQI
ncbi:hypothetical protein BEWA_047450 [Theileria equi strain WA]|uniref:Uncharacterized protein n=1 Tax=Theileria equi strain WA TaxID=1537102 RepID=L1LAI5_THEEQ|nr:hypothetical protein BEWA_047450 [Theileria equi strain WA]EKX72280.1 hypothetical protein BEWA_047450 [Theileria equi strain WA]|eukprot:XP_004831732.1 hypothetical protein BEWA_047450 [Theileria equi strain WA]